MFSFLSGFIFRWIPDNQCINIEIAGNSFVLLPSVTDHYFTIDVNNYDLTNLVNKEGSLESSSIFKLLQLSTEDDPNEEVKNAAQTFLVLPLYQNLSSHLSSYINQYPEFYLSTLLSASIHKQNKCIEDLENENIKYVKQGCIHFLGNE